MSRRSTDLTAALQALTESQRRLATAIEDLTSQQAEITSIQREQARQQAATNFIVRAQTTTDPEAKARYMAEAARLLDSERRQARHRATSPLTFPTQT